MFRLIYCLINCMAAGLLAGCSLDGGALTWPWSQGSSSENHSRSLNKRAIKLVWKQETLPPPGCVVEICFNKQNHWILSWGTFEARQNNSIHDTSGFTDAKQHQFGLKILWLSCLLYLDLFDSSWFSFFHFVLLLSSTWWPSSSQCLALFVVFYYIFSKLISNFRACLASSFSISCSFSPEYLFYLCSGVFPFLLLATVESNH